MPTPPPCPTCGRPVEGELCRICLVQGIISGESHDLEDLPYIDGYEVIEEVGRGGLGTVYRARQLTPDREVALKLVLDHELAGDDARQAFLQEVAFAAKLEHLAVTPIYETGRAEGFLYFSSRFMTGGNLAEHLAEFSPREKFSSSKNRQLQKQIARATQRLALALHDAHQHGIIHQDIKPSNILLDDQNEPYVSDFGLAVPIQDSPPLDTISGSPSYMAPEQITGEDCSAAIDIYALGVVLFELLTGQPPFLKRSLPDLFQEIRETPAAFPNSPHLDSSLKAIALKCLQKEPSQRYRSANALALDLDLWLQQKPITAQPLGTFSRLKLWARRRPGIAALSAISLLSAGLLALLLLLGTNALRKERNHALSSEKEALESNEKATTSATRFREHAYAADMFASSQARERGQIGFASQLLNRHLPKLGDPPNQDPRGFEWFAYHAINKEDPSLVFREHSAPVTATSFSPDGRYLASVGQDHKIIIRDLHDKKIVLTLPRENAPKPLDEVPLFTSIIAKSPVLIEKIFSRELNFDGIRQYGRPSHIGDLLSFEWAPDGQSFATGSRKGFVRIWSFPEGHLITVLPSDMASRLAFSPDGKQLACFSHETDTSSKINVYHLDSLKEGHTFTQLDSPFAHQKSLLAFYHQPSREVRIFSFEDDALLYRWPLHKEIERFAFTEDGQHLIAQNHKTNTQYLHHISDGRQVHRASLLPGNTSALLAYGDHSISAGLAQVITFQQGYDPPQRTFLRGHFNEILDLDLSPKDRLLASASRDKTLRVWDLKAASEPEPKHLNRPLPILCHSPDARSWLARSPDTPSAPIFLTSFSTELPLAASKESRALCFHATAPKVATWKIADGKILIEWWSTNDGELLKTEQITPPTNLKPPWKIACSGDRRTFAINGDRTPFYFYDIESLSPIGSIPRHNHGTSDSPFYLSNDGRRLMVFGWPRTFQVGELGTGWFGKWEATQGLISAKAFSSDGKHLITGDHGNRISIHEAHTGKLLHTLIGTGGTITAVAPTPDGRTLAASFVDNTVQLWHLPTKRQLGLLHKSTSVPVENLRFSDDSRTLLLSTGHYDGRKVWIHPKE